MSKATFVITQTTDGQFQFVLRATNNEPILTSERYTARHNAVSGVEAARISATHADRFERRDSIRGEPYFVLKGGNHEIVGVSEMYSSPAKRDEGIDAVRRHAPGAEVVAG
jgi:uncharacterized protein YegP (UPF0339 family)